MQNKILVAACLCVSFVSAWADDSGEVSLGDFLLIKSPAFAPSTRLEYSAASEVDFDSAAGGFSYNQLSLGSPLAKPYRINPCNMVVFSARYDATWLDTDTFLDDMKLHDFRLNVRWMYRQPDSKWAWTMALSPGISTDGEGIGSDDFSINGTAGFRYARSSSFAWIGGVVFFHNALETRVFPGIGFQWRPADDLLVRWMGPNLRAAWQPTEDWILHAGVRIAGGTWNVEQNGTSYNVDLQTFQASVGVERQIADQIWLGLWGGLTFGNELEIETSSGARVFKDDADMGWFVQLGIRRSIW
ncbi:MAG: hypothetical protein KJO79_02060 [Verrucomicrobiae bacterium]|nr:hypothetical protein [Verrucomicrobiae bacterium]NNJ85937.1 hypothetical protein [Akkermansiaceae bacterium]